MDKKENVSTPPVGYKPTDWFQQALISRSTYFALPEDCQPQAVRIGRRVIIIETPAAWLSRMAARGGIPSSELAA